MNIKLNTTGIHNAEYQQEDLPQANAQGKVPAPILAGDSISITSSSDFQKLLAQLNEEMEKYKLAATQLTLSASLNAILGTVKGVAESQRKQLELISQYSNALDDVAKNMRGPYNEKQKAQMKKEALKKELKEIQEKIDALDPTAPEYKEKLTALEQTKESIQTGMKQAQGIIDDCTQKLASLEKQRNELKGKLEEATKKLNGQGIAILNAACLLTLDEADKQPMEQKKDEEKEEKARELSIPSIIAKQLEEITRDLRDEILTKRNQPI